MGLHGSKGCSRSAVRLLPPDQIRWVKQGCVFCFLSLALIPDCVHPSPAGLVRHFDPAQAAFRDAAGMEGLGACLEREEARLNTDASLLCSPCICCIDAAGGAPLAAREATARHQVLCRSLFHLSQDERTQRKALFLAKHLATSHIDHIPASACPAIARSRSYRRFCIVVPGPASVGSVGCSVSSPQALNLRCEYRPLHRR